MVQRGNISLRKDSSLRLFGSVVPIKQQSLHVVFAIEGVCWNLTLNVCQRTFDDIQEWRGLRGWWAGLVGYVQFAPRAAEPELSFVATLPTKKIQDELSHPTSSTCMCSPFYEDGFAGDSVQLEDPGLTRVAVLRAYDDCLICMTPRQGGQLFINDELRELKSVRGQAERRPKDPRTINSPQMQSSMTDGGEHCCV